MPSESYIFTTRVDPVSPPQGLPPKQCRWEVWWRRRVPPPGPQRLFHAPFIAIVGKPTLSTIGSWGQKKRGRAVLPLDTMSWMVEAWDLIVLDPVHCSLYGRVEISLSLAKNMIRIFL
jgi:hypothetical protein